MPPAFNAEKSLKEFPPLHRVVSDHETRSNNAGVTPGFKTMNKNIMSRLKKLSFTLSLLALLSLMPTLGRAQPDRQPFGSGHFQPIAAWSFDQINADRVLDLTGNGFDALLHPGVAFTTGPDGGPALEFDGTGNNWAWFGQPQANGLSIARRLNDAFQQLSIEAWIRKQPGPWMSIVYRDLWDSPSGFGLVADWQAGRVFFGHYDQSGHKSYAVSQTVVQDGSWHHIVGTMQPAQDGYLYRIYVDGKLDAEQVGQWGIEAAPENGGILKIAYPNASGADYPYCGALAHVAIYDKALPSGQVQARYQQTKSDKSH